MHTMNLCGASESVAGTPKGKALPMSQTRPPPSPLVLSIAPPEFQTPRSVKGESFGIITATPSPALLNPLTHEFWNDSSSARRAPIFCPKLDSAPTSNEPLIRRLLSGFRVKIHDGSCDGGRVVEIRLSDDRTILHVIDDTMTEPSESQTLYKILIDDIARVDDSGEGFLSPNAPDVDPQKCFSIVTSTSYGGCLQFDFECIATKQREAIVSALRTLSGNKREKSIQIRRRSLPSFRAHSSVPVLPNELDLVNTPEAMLSPMQRTCIYPGAGSMEEGTELALRQTEENDQSLGNQVSLPRRKSVPRDPFSFSDVSGQQSLDEQQDTLEASSSLFAASFQEILDEWCTEDACAIDLTEVSESLQGIFFLLGSQTHVEGSKSEQHVRGDSSDMKVATMCVADFLDTSASFFADLPSPLSSDEKQNDSARSRRKLQNRARVANAQARRWRKLKTEMTFESFDTSDMTPTIATTKTFDDLDDAEARAASSQRVESGNFTDTSGYGLFELFPAGLWGGDTDDLVLEDEDCLFYDSEPESSRVFSRRKGLRCAQIVKPHKTAVSVDKETPSRLNFSVPHHLGSRFDDDYASAIIDIMKSEQLALLWHPTPSQAVPTRSPLCVTAWIERGTYLMTQAFIQPKFMWRPAREMNLESKRLNVATEGLERLDLLDIARIQETPNIDRKQFPFVNKRRCFLIETQNEIYLFEAQSVCEKKRIVFGLKLTVSRLASLIMIRDAKAVEEFFEPAQVPGEAPAFAM